MPDVLVRDATLDVYTGPGKNYDVLGHVKKGSILTALGRSQELVMHVGAGLNVGLTEEQIREIFLQVALYAGAPAAIQAYRVANDRFEEIRNGKD